MGTAVPSTALLNKRLTAQNAALEGRVREQEIEIRRLREANAKLSDQIEQLLKVQHELQSAVNALLKGRGPGAPTIDPNQQVLFADALQNAVDQIEVLENVGETLPDVDPEDLEVPDGELPDDKPRTKKRKPSKRKIDESNLRREVTRSELPEDQRCCPTTGVPLVPIGSTVTLGLDYRRAEVIVTEHHQTIYGPAPEIAAERKIEPIKAAAFVPAVEGVTAGPSLLAWVLCQKYVLHLPLYRQEDAFARLDVRLSRKTLCDWFLKSAFALRPIAAEIERQIHAGPILHLDDTPVKCMVVNETSGRKKIKQCYLWAFANPAVSGVVFRFTSGRATDDLLEILCGFDNDGPIEYFVGDGYATNGSAAREADLDVIHVGCWAHVLRKFRDGLSEAPNAMKLILSYIDLMYEIEERASREGLDYKERLALRRKETLPIVARLMRFTSGWKQRYSLKGKVAEAMRYVRNQRRALVEFLKDGRVPIDNNICERAIRPIAVGRRNWLFSGGVEGAEGAAIIYTLVESAKASGVDPYAYLKAVLERQGTWPSSRLGELVPWAMASELPRYSRRDDE